MKQVGAALLVALVFAVWHAGAEPEEKPAEVQGSLEQRVANLEALLPGGDLEDRLQAIEVQLAALQSAGLAGPGGKGRFSGHLDQRVLALERDMTSLRRDSADTRLESRVSRLESRLSRIESDVRRNSQLR